MELDELRKLCALLREEGLSELTIWEEDGRRITLRRAAASVPVASVQETTEALLVRSPVVGTFWRGPSPGGPPFVEVGERVEPGKVMCIVEAMKVMNEVRADQACTVEEILVEDGKPVEYGQPLFRVRVE